MVKRLLQNNRYVHEYKNLALLSKNQWMGFHVLQHGGGAGKTNHHDHAETAEKWVYVTVSFFFWLVVLLPLCLFFPRQIWQMHIKMCSLLRGDKDQLGAGVATSHQANEWAQRLFHTDPTKDRPSVREQALASAMPLIISVSTGVCTHVRSWNLSEVKQKLNRRHSENVDSIKVSQTGLILFINLNQPII